MKDDNNTLQNYFDVLLDKTKYSGKKIVDEKPDSIDLVQAPFYVVPFFLDKMYYLKADTLSSIENIDNPIRTFPNLKDFFIGVTKIHNKNVNIYDGKKLLTKKKSDEVSNLIVTFNQGKDAIFGQKVLPITSIDRSAVSFFKNDKSLNLPVIGRVGKDFTPLVDLNNLYTFIQAKLDSSN